MMVECVLPNLKSTKALVLLFQYQLMGKLVLFIPGNIPIFRYRLFKLILNTQNSPLLHFKCTNECDLLCVHRVQKTNYVTHQSFEGRLCYFYIFFSINLYLGGKSQIATYDLFVRVKPSTNLSSTVLYCSHFTTDRPYAHLAPDIQTTSDFLLVFLLVSVIV